MSDLNAISNAKSENSTEIKPSFSIKYIGLVSFVGLVPTLIGGIIGYIASEYVKDRKIIEVSSINSGNLVSIPSNIAGSLEVLFAVSNTQKEQVKNLFRYEVTLANRSREGVENLSFLIVSPKGVNVVQVPEVATVPSNLAKAITVRQTPGTEKIVVHVNLLNPSQSLTLAYLGFARDDPSEASKPMSVVIQKKDWLQRDVEKSEIGQTELLDRFLKRKITDLNAGNLILVFLFSAAFIGFLYGYVVFTWRIIRSSLARVWSP